MDANKFIVSLKLINFKGNSFRTTMGSIMDIARSGSHDYVDNPFWSVMQIKVKMFAS